MDTSPLMRILMGFTAAAIAMLLMQQGVAELLLRLDMPGLKIYQPPFDTTIVPPLGLPKLLQLCLWGGLYGTFFGLLSPALFRPLWVPGVVVGMIAAVGSSCASAALRGLPAGPEWLSTDWGTSLLLWGCWGLGLGIFYPLLAPDPQTRP